MEDREQRKLDRAERQAAYMAANAADYVANSPGARVAALMVADIVAVRDLAAGQTGGASERSQHVNSKRDDLDDLKELMRLLDRAGDALEDEFSGIENLFGLPRNRNEHSILAAAQAQYEASAQYEAALIEYDLPAAFRAEMRDLMDDINAANQAADASGTAGAGSTGGLKATIERLNQNSKKLDNINHNKLRNDPAKLAAWIVASHLERAPKSIGKKNNPQK